MFMTALPTSIESAAASLAAIGGTVAAGNAAGSATTIGVVPPAAEPASALLAAAFGTHAGVYQVTQAIGSVIHEMFVATLAGSAGSYAAAEALNIAAMI